MLNRISIAILLCVVGLSGRASQAADRIEAGDPLGACCLQDCSCILVTQAECGGTWQGSGTVCAPNPCSCPQGACCFPDGVCIYTTQMNCELSGGVFHVFESCSPNPCPELSGACCLPDGTCIVTVPSLCAGDFLGAGTSCDPGICEIGACCDPRTYCTEWPRWRCEAYGGTFLGSGTLCQGTVCPILPGYGACCCGNGEECVITTQAECEVHPDCTWMGDGVSCSPSPCVVLPTLGACCTPGGGGPCGGSGPCVTESAGDCELEGGTYQGDGTSCDPYPCPPGPICGACCFANGECLVETQGDCEGQDGVYWGDNTDCDPSPCVPVSTERSSWGRIKSRYR